MAEDNTKQIECLNQQLSEVELLQSMFSNEDEFSCDQNLDLVQQYIIALETKQLSHIDKPPSIEFTIKLKVIDDQQLCERGIIAWLFSF